MRSPGGHPYEAVEDREAIDSGRRAGPRLFLNGYLLDGARPYYPMASAAPTEAVVDMEVGARIGSSSTCSRRRPAARSAAAARDRGCAQIGIPVSSHEIYPAALSGVDSVEHGATSRRGYSPKQSSTGRAYEDVIQIIAKSQMTITPTAALGGFQPQVAREPAVLDDPRMQLFPQWVRDSARPAGRARRPRRRPGWRPGRDSNLRRSRRCIRPARESSPELIRRSSPTASACTASSRTTSPPASRRFRRCRRPR